MTTDLPINGRSHSVKTVREQEWLVQMFGPRQLQRLYDVIQFRQSLTLEKIGGSHRMVQSALLNCFPLNNLLSPNIYIQILHADFHTFPQ